MVNRGDGGARRPAPPTARPAPSAAKPGGRPAPVDDGEEKTSGFNLSDVNLDDMDEMPMPAAKPPARAAAPAPAPTARPKPPTPAAAPARRAIDDDDGNEKTSALNLAEINLDDEPAPKAAVKPQPGPRGSTVPPARPAPAAAQASDIERALRDPAPSARPPAPKRPSLPVVEDGNEKTSALNLAEINLDDEPAPKPKAPVPAAPASRQGPQTLSQKPPSAAPAPAPAPKAPARVEAPAPAKKAAEPIVEKTMAVSLEEFEQRTAKGPGKKDPAPADRTFIVDDDDVPVVKAPPPKKMGAAKAEEAVPADVDPKLVVRVGADVGKVYQMTKDLTLVGRGLDADFVVNDASASRKHFNIVRTLSGWKMVDLGSGNGTKVNGNRVSEIALQSGMKLELGATTLEWVHAPEAAPAKAPAGKAQAQAKVEAPAPMPGKHPQTISEDAAPVRRRVAEEKESKKRDASRFDTSKDKEDKPAPQEKTSFADIAALEIDPEWEARRQKGRKEGVREDMVAVSGSGFGGEDGEVEVDDVPVKKSGVGKKIGITFGVLAVLGGGFVAADKFGGLGIIFPVEAATTTTSDGGDKAGSDKDKDKAAGSDKDKAAATDKDKAAGSDKDKAATTDKDKVADADKDKAAATDKDKAAATDKDKAAATDKDKAAATDKDKAADADKDKAAATDKDKTAATDKDKAAATDKDKAAATDKDKAVPTTPATGDKKKDAEARVAEGQKALEGKQFLLARAKFAEATGLVDTIDGGAEGLAQVKPDLVDMGHVVNALGLMVQKKWADELKELDPIQDASSQAALAKDLKARAQSERGLELAGAAEDAFAKKDFAGAKAALDDLLKLKGLEQNTEALALKAAADKAMAPDADTFDVADANDPKGKQKAKPTDFKPYFAAYQKADFSAAIAFLDKAQPSNGAAGAKPTSKADAARAGAYQAAVYTMDSIYKGAIDAVAAGKGEETIPQLLDLRRTDAFAGGLLRTKIEGALAQAYVAVAKKAIDAKDTAKAALASRLALGFDPNNADAKTLGDDAVKAAKKDVADAKAAAAKEPDKAAAMLIAAIQVLPSDDPDSADALKALTDLTKPL